MNTKINNLCIQIKGYRAIERADISLNGITVLSGTNGTGKSTISRLVYEIIERANNYEDLVISEINFHLEKYYNVLRNLIYVIDSSSIQPDHSHASYYELMRGLSIDSVGDFDVFERTVSLICDTILALFQDEDRSARLSYHRTRSLLQNTLDLDSTTSFEDALGQMKNNIHQRILLGQKKIRTRPANVLNDSIKVKFGDSIKDCVSVYEYGDCIFGKESVNIPLPHFVQDIFYINTPFILGAESDRGHVVKLNRALQILKEPSKSTFADAISDSISKKIIKGRARFEKEGVNPGFRFFSDLNEEFDLEECATGVKSFSILQMLINNGYIKDNVLLILDEPEAHLHPQWIVEYARLIIMMNEKLGVRFLISSHSTDMILSLKYLAEAKKRSNVLEFYRAKSSDVKGKYVFESVGLDIEPIFESFNKSYTTLESYVTKHNPQTEW